MLYSKLAQAIVLLTYIQKVCGLNIHHNPVIWIKVYAYLSPVLSGTWWEYFLPTSLDITNHHSIPHTATPQLMTIPLTTNWSYDQNFLQKISIQSSRKMSLKLISKYISNCAHKVLSQRPLLGQRKELFLILVDLLGGCIFHIFSYCRLRLAVQNVSWS